MGLLSLCLLLTAAAGETDELKLAAPGLTITGLDPAIAGPLTDHLAKAFMPVRVITRRDIDVLLGLERQKELLGCAETTESCMAELGNALGAQGVLLGDIVKLGNLTQINLRVIDPVNGRPLASASARVDSEGAIFDALTAAAQKMRVQFLDAMAERTGPRVSSTARVTRRLAVASFVLGGALLLTGGIFLGLSNSAWQTVTAGGKGSLDLAEARDISVGASNEQMAAAVLLSVGVAAAVAGVALLVLGNRGEASAQVILAPNGLLLAGSF